MRGLIDRVALLLIALICSYIWIKDELIWVALIGIIFAAFSYYFESIKMQWILTISLSLLVLANDSYLPLFILIIYESAYMFWKGIRWCIVIPSMSCFAYVVLVKLGMERPIVMEALKQPFTGVFYVCMLGVAIYFSYISSNYQELLNEIKRIRDDNEEFRQITTENNKLLRQNQDSEITMATLKERNRIAREIHDNVGHLLSRSILQMGALQATYKEEPLATSLKQVNMTLNESMTSVRNSVHDLHNESLDLQTRVKEIIEKMAKYEIDLDYDLTTNIPMEIKYCFLSILQEAINNVEKHSDADKIWIHMKEHPAFYQLIIKDNGHVEKISDTGIGLHNMRTRVEELKGTLSFSVDKGFRIFLTIPKKGNREKE